MVFHRSLGNNKSPKVSMILLIILADLNYNVVGMGSILPLVSTSSNIFPCLRGPFQALN